MKFIGKKGDRRGLIVTILVFLYLMIAVPAFIDVVQNSGGGMESLNGIIVGSMDSLNDTMVRLGDLGMIITMVGLVGILAMKKEGLYGIWVGFIFSQVASLVISPIEHWDFAILWIPLILTGAITITIWPRRDYLESML